MLIIQYNCRCRYKYTIMTLETILSIKAEIILLQELFIYNQELIYSTFDYY